MSHNATGAALYDSSIDYASLSWVEQQWMAWYIYIGNPILATGLMSFLMHEVRAKFPPNILGFIFCRSSTLAVAFLG
jgi:hypothetical protein